MTIIWAQTITTSDDLRGEKESPGKLFSSGRNSVAWLPRSYASWFLNNFRLLSPGRGPLSEKSHFSMPFSGHLKNRGNPPPETQGLPEFLNFSVFNGNAADRSQIKPSAF